MAEPTRTVLIVEDEAAQRRLLGDFVASLGFRVEEAATAEDALARVRRAPPDLVLLDVRLPGMSGLEALAEVRRLSADLPVLLLTAHADVRQAVAALKSGADDYLAKPLDLEELATTLRDALAPADHPGRPGAGPPLPPGVVCASPAMRRLIETATVVAPSAAPVLLLGESGSGKEIIARLIHAWSPRAAGPLVTANCAGLPGSLVEAELFGHARGAFTGATRDRPGLFRAAGGGTLFLDEIGEMPLPLQPKLLRALEAGEITPVGSDTPVTVDVRLVAATNRDLAGAVASGAFREDLYYRINVVEMLVPPLRDRREDVLPLARRFTTEFAGAPVRLSPQALQCLLAHSWPGNVRELRNALQRACLLCRGDVVLPEHLPPKVAGLASQVKATAEEGRLSGVEAATIRATLEECGGNRTRAARTLGISRRTLIYKLQALESTDPQEARE